MKVSPSTLSRGLHCSFSLVASDNKPRTTHENTLKGKAAHWIAEEVLQGSGELSDYLNRVHEPTGVVITDEMIDYTAVYVEYCRALMRDQYGIEERLHCRLVHEKCNGVVDFYALIGGRLVVVDFKYGMKWVEPINNVQLSIYATTLAEKYNLPIDTPVTLVIVQPRTYHPLGRVREFHTVVGNVNGLVNIAHKVVSEAERGNTIAVTGSHCYKCPHLHNCKAVTAAGYNAIDFAASSDGDLPNLSATDIAHQLTNIEDAIELLKMRADALDELATIMVKSGIDIPGRTLEQSFSRPKWGKPKDEVKALGEALGVPLVKEELITPSQAVKAGLSKEALKGLTVTYKNASKLKRVDLNLAKMLFSRGIK